MPEQNGLEKRVRELEQGFARSDGVNTVKWDNQVVCNKDYEERLDGVERSYRKAAPILLLAALVVTALSSALGTWIVRSLLGGKS